MFSVVVYFSFHPIRQDNFFFLWFNCSIFLQSSAPVPVCLSESALALILYYFITFIVVVMKGSNQTKQVIHILNGYYNYKIQYFHQIPRPELITDKWERYLYVFDLCRILSDKGIQKNLSEDLFLFQLTSKHIH